MFLRFLLLILLCLPKAYSNSMCFDEDNHNISHNTKNDLGSSSYHCAIVHNLLKSLINEKTVTPQSPALDFGAGYGCVTYELAQFGFNNIIVSEIDEQNIKCLKHHLNKHFFSNKQKISFLIGDIINNGQYASIQDDSLGLVYARNVIHLMNANDIIKLLLISHQKLKKNGVIILEYENDSRDRLSEIINLMSKEIKANTHADMELNIVKQHYEKLTSCSFDDYLTTDVQYRTPGFPCQVHTFMKNTYKPVMYHYIDHRILTMLLVKMNFKILRDTLSNQRETGTIVAQKITDNEPMPAY